MAGMHTTKIFSLTEDFETSSTLTIGSSKSRGFRKATGYGWVIAGLVTAGDLAGAGFVSLPTATVQTQFYPGIILILVLGFLFYYTSYLLGECWSILLKKYPRYQVYCRTPYAEIGKRALGEDIGIFVSAIINVTQFGICVVYFLLAANNLQNFIKIVLAVDFSFCFIILIVGLIMLPLLMLKSPVDFWYVMVGAMLCTLLATILITLGAALDYKECHVTRHTPGFDPVNYFLAFGTILFAYGGHAAYPTIQQDMRNPLEWRKSVMLSYSIALTMYLPPSVLGYWTYGDSLRNSVINSLQIKAVQQAVNIFVTLHVILSLTIMMNPVSQEAEDFFGTPQEFGWKRIKIRFLIMLAVIFTAESMPSIAPMMNIVGSTGITVASTIFPCLFYLYLSVGEAHDIESPTYRDVLKYTPRKTLTCCFIVMLFGVLGGSAATFTSIKELSHDHLVPPCYLAPFLNSDMKFSNGIGDTNCCGRWQNISKYSDVVCSKPDMSFYH